MDDSETPGRLMQLIGRLKSSHLLMIVTGLFLLDLVIPDPLFFVDEAILLVLTVLVGRWQLRKTEPPHPPKPPPKDVTPRSS